MTLADPVTIGTLITVALGSSVIGTALTQGFTTYRESDTKKRELEYLALRLAIAFERFAEDATAYSSALGSYEMNDERGVIVKIPKMPAFPDDKERWRDLDVRVTSAVLGFDHIRRSRQGSIDDTWENASPEDGIDVARIYGIQLGHDALEIARKIRLRYKLPPLVTPAVWPEHLQTEWDKIDPQWRDDQTSNKLISI